MPSLPPFPSTCFGAKNEFIIVSRSPISRHPRIHVLFSFPPDSNAEQLG